MATIEDGALIEMALAGQTECFSVLMTRHAAAVRRCIALMVRNRSDVEDLVQDTFLKAWLHLANFRFEASFRTWITSVASNEALALYRRRNRRPFCPATANLETLASPCESPHQIFARSEARGGVRRAIERLPGKYREILMLCELEELSTLETAQRLRASVPLVKTRLFRARRMLSAALNRSRC